VPTTKTARKNHRTCTGQALVYTCDKNVTMVDISIMVARCFPKNSLRTRTPRLTPSVMPFLPCTSLNRICYNVTRRSLRYKVTCFRLKTCLFPHVNCTCRSAFCLNSHVRSSDRAPRARNQDSALHRLNERHRLVHRLAPPLDAPALLTADLALLQVGKLPQVVHRVQLADLYEPSAYALHDLPAGFQTAPPMCLPLKQVSRV